MIIFRKNAYPRSSNFEFVFGYYRQNKCYSSRVNLVFDIQDPCQGIDALNFAKGQKMLNLVFVAQANQSIKAFLNCPIKEKKHSMGFITN